RQEVVLAKQLSLIRRPDALIKCEISGLDPCPSRIPRTCVSVRLKRLRAERREAAEIFKVGVSSVIRWCRSWSETGSAAPKQSCGSVSPLEEHSDWILALIAKQPDLTIEETLAAMAKQGIPGSRSALQRFFDRHNVSFKKKSAR